MIPVSFRELLREATRGKSVGRILADAVLVQWRDEVHGLVLDLAGGKQDGGSTKLSGTGAAMRYPGRPGALCGSGAE